MSTSLDTTSFDQAFGAFMANSKRDVAVVLRQQAKLLTSDCCKLTPPFSKAVFGNPASESFAAQKRIGDNAVRTQIQGLFVAVNDSLFMKSLENEKVRTLLKGYVAAGDFHKFNTYLERVKSQARFIPRATVELHSANRDRRGHVRKKNVFIIFAGESIGPVLKLKLSHVGQAKAGWCAAARKFGLNLPNWITRHSTPGTADDHSNHPTNPSIEIHNQVAYESALAGDAENNIIGRALEFRTRAMMRMLEFYQNKRAQEFSR